MIFDEVWQDFALCQNLPTEAFFDDYEKYEILRPVMKSICDVCPVRRECLLAGKETNEWGLWGGIDLSQGVPTDK